MKDNNQLLLIKVESKVTYMSLKLKFISDVRLLYLHGTTSCPVIGI